MQVTGNSRPGRAHGTCKGTEAGRCSSWHRERKRGQAGGEVMQPLTGCYQDFLVANCTVPWRRDCREEAAKCASSVRGSEQASPFLLVASHTRKHTLPNSFLLPLSFTLIQRSQKGSLSLKKERKKEKSPITADKLKSHIYDIQRHLSQKSSSLSGCSVLKGTGAQ